MSRLNTIFPHITLKNGTFDHRVFPAAQLEVYNSQEHQSHKIVGVLMDPHKISIQTAIHASSSSSSLHDTTSIDKVLKPAIDRFLHSLAMYPDFAEDYPVNPSNSTLKTFVGIGITVKSQDIRLYHGVPEDYELTILADDSVIRIQSTTVFGALRGLETLGQLLEFGWLSSQSSDSKSWWYFSPHTADAMIATYCIYDIPLYISDAPSYPYRGLMIDTARHYLPLDLILDNLDAMAMNKLNVLHWHLSDSQSFPFALPSYPELAERGAYHPKRIYTSKDVQTVIQQAYLRGIRVIPEIDMPGHTAAIAKSHQEVMAHCPTAQEPMNPTVDATYHFVQNVYQDLKDIFPDDFVHVGGDEVWMSERCWLNDTRIASWMKEHGMSNETVQLYEYFETRLLKIVSNLDKTPIVWQEVFNLNLSITPNTIVDVWKGFDKYTIQNATNQGYQVILSGCWYLDHLVNTWEDYYKCNPRNFTGNKDLMIGGHASMWGEHVDASNFISRVWPRASAVAERLWTGDVENGPVKSIANRIEKFRCLMVQKGFVAGPTRPGSCPKEVLYSRGIR
ncbi:beta-N-acetylhexosaminidase [Nitzschia inconspicua]|uniref:Beta-hexosaminidase n=1 Tax=Nitzschia inconspicua TaxID=303405 RepID=A0A9K3M716_9STRA|nr:beta-N-acetylhexosaminidase [Nitzschia inconspicua]